MSTPRVLGIGEDGDGNAIVIYDNKAKEKSIRNDLAKYQLPDVIIDYADQDYKLSNNGICRQSNRHDMLFYYTLSAYRKFYPDVDPNEVGKIFNMKPADITHAVTSFTDKTVSKIVFTSPCALISFYCKKLNLNEESIEDVLSLTESVIRKEITLLNKFPQTVAAGIIYYYFQSIGYEPERPKLMAVLNRSMPTIKKIAAIIAEVDNR